MQCLPGFMLKKKLLEAISVLSIIQPTEAFHGTGTSGREITAETRC